MQSSCAGSGRSLAAPEGCSRRGVFDSRQTKYWHDAAAVVVAREARGSHNKSAVESWTVILPRFQKGRFHDVHRKKKVGGSAETDGGEKRLNRRSFRWEKENPNEPRRRESLAATERTKVVVLPLKRRFGEGKTIRVSATLISRRRRNEMLMDVNFSRRVVGKRSRSSR